MSLIKDNGLSFERGREREGVASTLKPAGLTTTDFIIMREWRWWITLELWLFMYLLIKDESSRCRLWLRIYMYCCCLWFLRDLFHVICSVTYIKLRARAEPPPPPTQHLKFIRNSVFGWAWYWVPGETFVKLITAIFVLGHLQITFIVVFETENSVVIKTV